jgi:hypothetical protein
MLKKILLIVVLFMVIANANVFAMHNLINQSNTITFPYQDTTKPKPVFFTRKATIRSAILPGWGQIYNKKYWKLPLVYGALGTTAGIFIYNVKTYRSLRDAYRNLLDGDDTNNGSIDARFKNLNPNAVKSYRNSFRQNVDYSVLFFILAWGLNVVDATVDAHLKAFDVNDNLNVQIKPSISPMAGTAGISVVFNIGKRPAKERAVFTLK